MVRAHSPWTLETVCLAGKGGVFEQRCKVLHAKQEQMRLNTGCSGILCTTRELNTNMTGLTDLLQKPSSANSKK
eukprot:536173-Pelagomonas_calceolata.AAC.2